MVSTKERLVVLQAEDLVMNHCRGRQTVSSLAGVSLTAHESEFIVVMGPSGSGKSTLLQLLGLLDSPTTGRVFVRGVDASKLTDDGRAHWRRDHMGFVFQFFNLLPTLSARDNVTIPMLLAGRNRSEAERRADELLEWVGLSHRRRHLPSEMSGGEMQRTAIARALINNPELVLCDEPTGNLDSAGGHDVLELLKRMSYEHGRTILMVTHDSRAARIGDRLIRLKDGRIESEEAIANDHDDAVSAA